MSAIDKIYFLPVKAVLFLLLFFGVEATAQNFDFDDFFEEAPNLEEEFIVARMYMITGQYDEAATRLNDLLSKDPDNGVFLYELSRTYEALGEREKALDAAQSAHRNAPDNSWILQLLANISSALDRNDLAEDAYRKLLEIQPHRSNYAISRAYHLLMLSDREEAIRVLDRTESLIGVTPELSAKKISIYRGDGNTVKIEAEYRSLLEAFPHNNSFRLEMVDFFLFTNQEGKAIATLEEILEIDPEQSRAQVLLARLKGSTEEDPLLAIHPVIANPSIDPDEKIRELFPFLIKLSEDYDPELAWGLSNAAVVLTDLHPQRAEVFAIAGDVAFSSYQFAAAKEYYSKGLDLRSNVIQVWFNYLESVLRLRDYDQLLQETERAIDYYPNQALFYYYLSRAYSGIGKPVMGKSAFSRADLMSRRQPGLGAYMRIAEAELELASGNGLTAFEIIESGLGEMGLEADLLLTKARILTHFHEDEEQLQKVLSQLEKIVPWDPDYLIFKALFLHRKGEMNEAANLMDKIKDYDFSFSKHVLEAGLEIYKELRPERAAEILEQLNKLP